MTLPDHAEPEAEAALEEPAAPPKPPPPWVDRVLRLLGGLFTVLMALLTGLLELYLAPLRVGGVLIGAAALVVIPVNVFLAWYARRAIGTRFAFAWPWITWTLLMFVAAGVRTDEGDQLIAGDNWVGMVLILTGSIAFAAYAYRIVLNPPPRG